jgi:DNA-binding NarL/FixJ family response regulator
MKTLIVDDSALVRQSMKKLLTGINAIEIVGEAETLCAALELIQTTKAEVVILDLALKNGSGFEVIKKAKARENSPLVIVLTNCTALPFREKAQQEGADFFFDKSTEFEQVLEVLRQKAAQVTTNTEVCQ